MQNCFNTDENSSQALVEADLESISVLKMFDMLSHEHEYALADFPTFRLIIS